MSACLSVRLSVFQIFLLSGSYVLKRGCQFWCIWLYTATRCLRDWMIYRSKLLSRVDHPISQASGSVHVSCVLIHNVVECETTLTKYAPKTCWVPKCSWECHFFVMAVAEFTLPLLVKLDFYISGWPNSGFYIKIAWKIDLDQFQNPLGGGFWDNLAFTYSMLLII